jgi:hypothetical protein
VASAAPPSRTSTRRCASVTSNLELQIFSQIAADGDLPSLAISRRYGMQNLENPNFCKFLFGGNVKYQWVIVEKIWKSVFCDAPHGLRLAVLIQDFAAEKAECPEIDSGK